MSDEIEATAIVHDRVIEQLIELTTVVPIIVIKQVGHYSPGWLLPHPRHEQLIDGLRGHLFVIGDFQNHIKDRHRIKGGNEFSVLQRTHSLNGVQVLQVGDLLPRL